MRKTSPSLPDFYSGLSGSFFIDTSSSERPGCHSVTSFEKDWDEGYRDSGIHSRLVPYSRGNVVNTHI